MAYVHLAEDDWRKSEWGGAAVGGEGGAMKVSRDGLICRGGSETRRYGSIAGHVEILGLGSEGAKSEAAARLLAEVSRGCGAFEWVTFGYLGWILLLLAMCHRNIPHAMSYFAVHCAIASGILWLAWVAACSENPALQFARHWYPLALYIFFFEELRGLVHAIFPGWFDRWLILFDYNFGGVHPAAWFSRFAAPGLNEFMQFSYMTYFLYLVILPAMLYAQERRAAFWTVMVATAIAHYSVYVIAVLLPVESPYFALASLRLAPLEGGAFTTTIEFIERFGRVHGGAFPSAHVAGSMVALLAARRYKHWLFWIYLPLFLSMCVATVYGRYHYIADVLAGIVVGATGWAVGQWVMDREGAAKCRGGYRSDAKGGEKGDGKSAAGLTSWQAGARQAAPLPERGGVGQNIFSGRRRVPTEPRLEMRKTQRY
jgi:membrane-associated phospholipid phosphatase